MKAQRIPHGTEPSAPVSSHSAKGSGMAAGRPWPCPERGSERSSDPKAALCSLSTRQSKCSVQPQEPWLGSCPRSAAAGQRGPVPPAQHPWEPLLPRLAGLPGPAGREQQALLSSTFVSGHLRASHATPGRHFSIQPTTRHSSYTGGVHWGVHTTFAKMSITF